MYSTRSIVYTLGFMDRTGEPPHKRGSCPAWERGWCAGRVEPCARRRRLRAGSRAARRRLLSRAVQKPRLTADGSCCAPEAVPRAREQRRKPEAALRKLGCGGGA
jgi:hypothetical protein